MTFSLFTNVIIVFTIVRVTCHQAEVSAPWIITNKEAHSFLTKPTRSKRSDPRCNTDEPYCESNKGSCMLHNEQSREHYCGLGHTCSSTQACYLSTPCPAHYALGCTDNQCLSFPCYNGGTCTDTSTSYVCTCVPGYDPATSCSTDYDECQSNPCQNGGSCNNNFNSFTCDCSDRFEGEICEKDCRPGPVDLVFIIDNSDSMNSSVARSVDFLKNFLLKVPISADDFQVGVLTYNFEPTVLFDLDDYNSTSDIFNILNSIKGENGVTYTARALDKAYELLSSSTTGSRLGVYKYIVLFYDGLSTDHSGVIQKAALLNNLGLRILTVGVGESISHMEMVKVSGQQQHTFSPLDSNEFYNHIMTETVHTDCNDCVLTTSTDLLLLVDTSSNQTNPDFRERLQATRSTIERVLSYNNNVSIGMYSYSDEIDYVFSLNWSNDSDKLIAEALSVGKDSYTSIANTSHALQHIRLGNIFSSPKRIIAILSNGQWMEQGSIKSEVDMLSSAGVDVVSIVTGEDSTTENFNHILQDPSLIFYVGDGDYTALDSLAAWTKSYVCIDNIFNRRQ